MIVVRNVLQAKFGHGGELAGVYAASLEKVMTSVGRAGQWRVLTDLTGPFDNVVLEFQAESMADWESARGKIFSSPSFGEMWGKTQPLIESGRNEVFTIEAQGK